MAKGTFAEKVYSYEYNPITGDESEGSVASVVVEWESTWKSGNLHTMKIKVRALRTDGSYSATFSGRIKVGENSSQDLGAQNYPGDPAYQESFDPVEYEVETDDYGKLLTKISVSVEFVRSATEVHCATVTSTGVSLDKPQKLVSITCPEGIICTVDKSKLYIDDQFVISVTVVGMQWSESPIISVTGATKVKDLTYQVTGDIYIVITGVLAVHKIYIKKTAGLDITITDVANGYLLSDGSSVEHYTKITITCSAKPGYEFKQLTVNGNEHKNGDPLEVTSDITIVAVSDALGLAHIYTGSSFEDFHVFIYNGNDWGMYIPFIYNGLEWNIYA